MGLFGDLGGSLFGGLAGLFGGDGGSSDAEKYYKGLAAQAGGLDPRIAAQQAANDPGARAAQEGTLRDLQGISNQGGLDAIGKSQIAGAETEANRNAAARSNQIQEQARSQGQGNSAVTLALQQQAGQQAGQTANQQAMQSAGLAQQNRMAALQGAGQLGGQMGQQANAINQFNAGMRQNAAQQTFGNQMGQLGTQAGLYGGAYGAQQAGDQRNRALWAGVGQGIGGLADLWPGSNGMAQKKQQMASDGSGGFS